MLSSLIEQYGYIAVFVGCFLEGETILVLAGFAAHQGYLSLYGVAGTAAVAGFLGDEAWFAIGRRYGDRVFDRFPALRHAETRIHAIVAKYGAYAAFGVRFLVGMRIAGPIVMGGGGMRMWKFAPANAGGALVWASAFSVAGYVFGEAFTRFMQHARHFEEAAFMIVAIVGLIAVLMVRRRTARKP